MLLPKVVVQLLCRNIYLLAAWLSHFYIEATSNEFISIISEPPHPNTISTPNNALDTDTKDYALDTYTKGNVVRNISLIPHLHLLQGLSVDSIPAAN